jgi:hypothetical protein
LSPVEVTIENQRPNEHSHDIPALVVSFLSRFNLRGSNLLARSKHTSAVRTWHLRRESYSFKLGLEQLVKEKRKKVQEFGNYGILSHLSRRSKASCQDLRR